MCGSQSEKKQEINRASRTQRARGEGRGGESKKQKQDIGRPIYLDAKWNNWRVLPLSLISSPRGGERRTFWRGLSAKANACITGLGNWRMEEAKKTKKTERTGGDTKKNDKKKKDREGRGGGCLLAEHLSFSRTRAAAIGSTGSGARADRNGRVYTLSRSVGRPPCEAQAVFPGRRSRSVRQGCLLFSLCEGWSEWPLPANGLPNRSGDEVSLRRSSTLLGRLVPSDGRRPGHALCARLVLRPVPLPPRKKSPSLVDPPRRGKLNSEGACMSHETRSCSSECDYVTLSWGV